jgi:hypothetical protein
MSERNVTKEEWVAMFEEAGLDEETMHRWHGIFEQRHPEAHQAFLEWLGIDAAEVAGIRQRFAGHAG